MGMWENGREQLMSGLDDAHDQAHPTTLWWEPKGQDSGKSDPSWAREKKTGEDNLYYSIT